MTEEKAQNIVNLLNDNIQHIIYEIKSTDKLYLYTFNELEKNKEYTLINDLNNNYEKYVIEIESFFNNLNIKTKTKDNILDKKSIKKLIKFIKNDIKNNYQSEISDEDNLNNDADCIEIFFNHLNSNIQKYKTHFLYLNNKVGYTNFSMTAKICLAYFADCETKKEIRKKYKKLAKIYHPDNRITGNKDIFEKITEEYHKLLK